MAETLVENRTCSKCGVDVRKGALFCYNCGGSVAPELPAPDNHKTASDAWFKENLVEEKPKPEISKPEIPEAEIPKSIKIIAAEEAKADEEAKALKEANAPETTDTPIKKPDVVEEAKLKSAASLRRKAKTFQKQKVEEIVWTGHENAPNGWFIAVAFVLTLIAGGIFWLAMSLK